MDAVPARPLVLPTPALVELFLVWRDDHANPLIPQLVEIAKVLAPAHAD